MEPLLSTGPDQKGFIESYARDILPHVRGFQQRVVATK